MALKIASLGWSKHHSLQHQLGCLLRLKSLWGLCVPHVVLAGELTAMQHGTALIRKRHPRSGMHIRSHGGHGTCLSSLRAHCVSLHGTTCCAGDKGLLPMAEAALGRIHDCGVLVNDLHRNNVVITQTDNKASLFFTDFSHASLVSPTGGQRKHELDSLCAALGGPASIR